MTGLLRLLRLQPDAVEADLSRYHSIDLRDLWRFGPDGRRLLTTRQVAARVRYLPRDSAVATHVDGGGLTRTDALLFDIFGALAGQQHPSDPRGGKKPQAVVSAAQMRAAKQRSRSRRQRLGITGSVLRKG